ncbi:hypothetical protein RJZ57_005052 [Blastomyces gilchristii]
MSLVNGPVSHLRTYIRCLQPTPFFRNRSLGTTHSGPRIASVTHSAAAMSATTIIPGAKKPMPSALTFNLAAKCSTTKARASTLHLPHGPVQLPIFMPVATQASLKGLTPDQLAQTGCKLCLNNTYHLGLKPGQTVLDEVGGAHAFQGWNGNILTDSGG